MVDSRPCSTCRRILPSEQLRPRSTGWFCGGCDDSRSEPPAWKSERRRPAARQGEAE